MEDKSTLFSLLENDIKIYEKIFVISGNCGEIISKFFKAVSCLERKIKIYLLDSSTIAIPENCEYQLMSVIYMDEFLKLYNMYEFSNRVQLISLSSQYASMFNYLSSGILTEDEFIEALLY